MKQKEKTTCTISKKGTGRKVETTHKPLERVERLMSKTFNDKMYRCELHYL